MKGLARALALLTPLAAAGCAGDEVATFSGPVLQRTSLSSDLLARAYANPPTASSRTWRMASGDGVTTFYYGEPSACPWLPE